MAGRSKYNTKQRELLLEYYTESPGEADEIAALIAGESCGEKEE